MNYRTFTAILFLLFLAAGLSGCSGPSSSSTNYESEADYDVTASSTDAAKLPAITDMFTDRDQNPDYDEENAITVTLCDNESSCNSDTVTISGQTITIQEEGTYILQGSLSDGQIVINVSDNEKVHLVLSGSSVNCSSSAAIYIKNADKTFITLADGTTNKLSTSSEYVQTDDNNIDAVIFSKDTLTLNGSGSLNIEAAYGHGIVSKHNLKITGGIYTISAEKHCLSGKDSIRILDGSYHLISGKDGLNSGNEDDPSLGYIYIAGGEFTISAQDDGMHSDSALMILDGTINIQESYEGLEGETITIAAGSITINASDDGMNASSGSLDPASAAFENMQEPPMPATDNDAHSGRKPADHGNAPIQQPPEYNENNGLTGNQIPEFHGDEDKFQDGMNEPFSNNCCILITGGRISIHASGDGIDSNGDLYISGGEIYVSGASNNGDGALDYAGEAVISGGILVAAGMSGMAQNFGEQSSQCSILLNLNLSETEDSTVSEIILTDSSGNILLTYTPEKPYDSVVVSCPDIQIGKTYSITACGKVTDIEMTSVLYEHGTNTMSRPDRPDR